jgi:chromosome segregation ATPase
VLFLCLSGQGCGEGRLEAEKKILANDPSFQKVIDKRNALQEQLDLQKTAFLKRKEKINEKIKSLKEERKQAKREYSLKVEKIKRQVYPEKRRLQRDLMEIERHYKWKKDELREIEKDIKEISALMEEKDKLNLTREEIKTWNGKLDSLAKKKEMVTSERNKLQTEVKITKMKIEVLD